MTHADSAPSLTAGPHHTSRRFDVDALRAIAFALLILYHIGMFYVSWGWHVKSGYSGQWLEPLMIMLNQWRMPLIFLISGLAVNFLLGEGPSHKGGYGSFVLARFRRLGPPLLFGMLVIVPPQAYFEALSSGVVEPGYLTFLLNYFSFQPWPAGAFAGSEPGITWNHLWYLPYLLLYTILIVPIAALMEGPAVRLRAGLQSLRGLMLLLVPVLWLLPIGIWVYPRFPYISHDLTSDFYAHAMYGSFFLFGYLIGRSPALWSEFRRMRWFTLALAPVTYLCHMVLSNVVTDQSGWVWETVQILVVYLNRWTWLLLVLGWAHQLLNRPMAWLGYANRAVFPWYVFHQSITVVAGYYLASLSIGPVLEPILLVLITFGGCALGMYLVDRWLPALRPLVGMKPRSPSSTVTVRPMASPL